MSRWVLDHGMSDLQVLNFDDKTPLQVAEAQQLCNNSPCASEGPSRLVQDYLPTER
jgi:hypothetical protein